MKKIIDDIRLIYKCCSLYYEDNMSQQEISETLQISRPSVARMIKSGRRSGIVKIEIKNPDNLMFANMERELEKKFGLEEVVIAAANSTEIGPNIINENLAQEMAKFLTRIAEDREYIGVTMGMTLRNLTHANLSNIEKLKCTFVPIVGGIGESRYDIHSNYIAMAFANIFKADCLQFFAPLVFSKPDLLNDFLQEESMQGILKSFNKISTVIMGIGIPDRAHSTILKAGYINEEMFDTFVKQGAVGDIAMQFFDKDGNVERFNVFNRLVSGMPIEKLKKIRRRIGMATGKIKADSVVGAIKGGFVNILIIDSECAQALLNYEE